MQFKTLMTAVAAAAAVGSVHAAVFPDFQVDPDMNPGTTTTPFATFTADKITGNYDEVITFTGPNSFAISLQWSAGQFVKNDGVTAIPAGDTGLGVNYALYALFQGTGTFSTSGGITTFNLNAGGPLTLWYDTSRNTTFTVPPDGATPYGTANTGDDKLLASGSAFSGTGTLDPSLPTCTGGGINCGSFGQQVSFNLTADGSKFFVDPVPFYSISFQSGQLNNFDIGGTQHINGSLDVVFAEVPEPASLGLVGLALCGLGMARRRRAR